jgi:iron complex outermembrane receptor protein
LSNAPEWSGSVSADYQFATGRVGTASLRGDVSWQSRVFFTPFNTSIETQPAYGRVHLRGGFEPRSRRWEIAVYARNVGNEPYITGAMAPNVGFPASSGRPGERASGARSSRFAADTSRLAGSQSCLLTPGDGRERLRRPS